MKTISECVNAIILQKPFISEALQHGLINSSSLARHIKHDIEANLKKKVQDGAVLMAINRFKDFKNVSVSRKLMHCLENLGDIIVRSDLSDYTYRNSPTLFNGHLKFINKLNINIDAFITFVQGVYESSYIISSSLSRFVCKTFEKEQLVSALSGLAAITVRLPAENINTVGLYHHILLQLAWNGVNIINTVSTANEFTVIVSESEIEKAFSAMKNLKKNFTAKR